MDITALSDGVFEVVEKYVDRRFSMLVDRIKALESRTPAPGKDGEQGLPGEPGRDGKDGAPGERGADGKDGMHGKDGAPGADGKDGEAPSLEVLATLIAGEVAKQVATIKVRDGVDGRDGLNGKDGTDGKDGRDGVDGIPGKDGMPGKDGTPGRDADPEYISKLVQASIAALPKPQDGKDGAPGKDGAAGLDGRAGKDAEVDYGKIVRDVLAEIPEPRDGRDGPRGQKGEPGRDGFGFDDLSGEQIDERRYALKFSRGDETKRFIMYSPTVLYRGIYEQKAYEAQDSVTYGGAMWIAKRDVGPADRPGDCDAWQLAVKRGRDGKA